MLRNVASQDRLRGRGSAGASPARLRVQMLVAEALPARLWSGVRSDEALRYHLLARSTLGAESSFQVGTGLTCPGARDDWKLEA
jgi:hypothetical protein